MLDKDLQDYQRSKEDSITAVEYCICALLVLFLVAGLLYPFTAQGKDLLELKPTWQGKVVWIEVQDPASVCAALRNLKVRYTNTSGCFYVSGLTCYMITLPIINEQGARVVGHEFVHCARGYFHDNEGNWYK